VVTKAEHCLVGPSLVNLTHGGRLESLHHPFRTITAANRGEKALVVPTMVNTRNGERNGQRPRVRGADQPLTTVTATGSQGGLSAVHLTRFYKSSVGQGLDRPAPTASACNHSGLVAAFLAKHNGKTTGQQLGDPMHTVTGRDTKGPVVAELSQVGLGRAREVAAFLVKYYGAGGQWQSLEEPLHTIVSKARFGLVTVEIGGQEYAITDIGFRMLQPRELARAQGFGEDYELIGTKSQQVARIGNSVCPQVAQALVEAQFGGPGCPDLEPHPDQVPLFGHR
jgi:DNA (cytosine-5)-methyltransferase 1